MTKQKIGLYFCITLFNKKIKMLETLKIIEQIPESINNKNIILLWIVGILILTIYFMPLLIQKHYGKITPWIFFINLFFGRTPLPYIVVILNIVEWKQIQILKAQGLLEKISIHPIYKESQSPQWQPISENFNHRSRNSN
uniref:Superinfection immunity protein n=1 Tax=Inoviridae sp. ctS4A1 TaxID=2825781 RepID=A0A8S5RTS8_9VIRU|nr:MAG TPA: Superinfection immunity protein [Inoviridae sp. ctS4A1]